MGKTNCIYFAYTVAEGSNGTFNAGPFKSCTLKDLNEFCLPFLVSIKSDESVLALGELLYNAKHINKGAFMEIMALKDEVEANGCCPSLKLMLEEILEKAPFKINSINNNEEDSNTTTMRM